MDPQKSKYISQHSGDLSVKAMARHLGVTKDEVREEMSRLAKAAGSPCEPGTSALSHPLGIWADLLIVFCIALAIRLIYQFGINRYPYLNLPAVDAVDYMNWAREIAAGDWMGKDVFFQAPGYPYFLGLLFSAFGSSVQVVQTVQQVLGALTCVFIYITADYIFGRTVALISGLLMAGYGLLICYAGFVIKPSVELFLLSVMLALLASQLKKTRYFLIFLAGVFLSLSALIIANLILFVPGVLFWFWLHFGKRHMRKFLYASIVFSSGVILTILPVTIRNFVVSGDFVFISSQGGMNLYIGNNPTSDGTYRPLYPWDATLKNEIRYNRELAEKETGKKLKPSEISQFWTSKALDFITQRPGEFAHLLLRKFILYWNAYEIPDTESYYFYQRFSKLLRLLPVRFGWIAVLGLTGIFISWHIPGSRILFLYVLGSVLITLPFFVLARYRVPVVLPLTILAANTCVETASCARQKNFKKLGLIALIAACGTGLVYSPFPIPLMKKAEISTAIYNLGAIIEGKGNSDQAIELYKNSADSFDRNLLPLDRLMNIYFRRGKLQDAENYARKILRLTNNRHPEAWSILGKIYVRQNKIPEARDAFQKALKLNPDMRSARRQLQRISAEKAA